MLLKILAIGDILAIISLLGISILPSKFILIMGLYLVMKGVLFMILGGSVPSLLDAGCGIYIIAVAFGIMHWIPTTIVIIYLAQKALVSMF